MEYSAICLGLGLTHEQAGLENIEIPLPTSPDQQTHLVVRFCFGTFYAHTAFLRRGLHHRSNGKVTSPRNR